MIDRDAWAWVGSDDVHEPSQCILLGSSGDISQIDHSPRHQTGPVQPAFCACTIFYDVKWIRDALHYREHAF